MVGKNGLISHTNDGGVTWNPQTANTNYHLNDVYFVDDQYGWVVGSEDYYKNWNGRVWRTTNGGKDWKESGFFSDREQGAHGKHGVDFIDHNTGYIVGQEVLWGSVHKSTDGGRHWKQLNLGGNYPVLNAVDFINPNKGWAVGESGFIIHTADGGNTWQIQASGITRNLTSVKFLNEQVGYVAAGGILLKTENGGLSWEPDDSISGVVFDVDFTDLHHGWVVGSSGVIYAYVDPDHP